MFSVFGFIVLGAIGFVIWVVKSYELNVHPDTFEFHSESKCDSVFVKVCGLQTKLFDHKEIDERYLLYLHSGNLVVPAKGYPCPVQLEIYLDGSTKILNAPDFNCHGCDVAGHHYKLFENEIQYSVRH